MAKVNKDSRVYKSTKLFLDTKGVALKTPVITNTNIELTPEEMDSYLSTKDHRCPVFTREMINEYETYYKLTHDTRLSKDERDKLNLEENTKSALNIKGTHISSSSNRSYYNAYVYIRDYESTVKEFEIVEEVTGFATTSNETAISNQAIDKDLVEENKHLKKVAREQNAENRKLESLITLTIRALSTIDPAFSDALLTVSDLGYKEGVGLLSEQPRAVTPEEYKGCSTIRKVAICKDKDLVSRLTGPITTQLQCSDDDGIL